MNSTQQVNAQSERSVFRLSMIADEPAYLLLTMDGVKIDPIVDELGGGGARIVCAKDFDRFDEGQIVGPAVLVLQDEGMPVVYPVVKWKRWPEFPATTIRFRSRPLILARFIAVPRLMLCHSSSSSSRRPSMVGQKRPDFGSKAGSAELGAFRFQGHTS